MPSTPIKSIGLAPVRDGGKPCPRHGCKRCSCGMGNLYRFVEPLLLLDLGRHPGASGYDILQRIEGHTLTGTTIDKAAVYRALGVLETNGMTVSEWTESVRGAGRKAYRLTDKGMEHLQEWGEVLGGLAKGLAEYGRDVKALTAN